MKTIELKSLRVVNARLRKKVEDLEYDLERIGIAQRDVFMYVPPELQRVLRKRQARLLNTLIRLGAAAHETLIVSARLSDTTTPERGLNVEVFKLRKALEPYDIKINNIHGWGYSLDEVSLARLRSHLSQQPVAIVGGVL